MTKTRILQIGCLAAEKRQPSSYSTSSEGCFPMFLLPTVPPSLTNCQSGVEMDFRGRVQTNTCSSVLSQCEIQSLDSRFRFLFSCGVCGDFLKIPESLCAKKKIEIQTPFAISGHISEAKSSRSVLCGSRKYSKRLCNKQ
ncbi:hypothetical protein CEXT_264831 [Caerostris extrusa]|uniref:Uncharacterized protein n=1 Tax=Caerostris extrusa TaxID=172846 RepID=A0AAV4ML96_CAEEX|nr:hypothetical protein CEXT_264831 [Caerostris extrusa]